MYTLRTLDPVTGAEVLTQIQFGTPGTGVLPVVGDWDGNGITDLGTWNSDTQTFYQRQAAIPGSKHTKLGREQFRAGDLPRSVRTR
jgi:hypothetical protein